MSRPRKSLHLKKGADPFEVRLIPVPVDTIENKEKLKEAYELVAYFIGLSLSKGKRRNGEEEFQNAA